MSKKIECKWGKSSVFSRKVVAHFILEDNPEYADCIEEKVDEWFSDFEGSTYEGDCMTGGHFLNWFETYFEDCGCNEENVLPYIKDLCATFSGVGDEVYRLFVENGKNDKMWLENVSKLKFFTYSRRMIQRSLKVFLNLRKDTVDCNAAIEVIKSFDKKFNWVSEYAYNPAWIVVFFSLVDYILKSGLLGEQNNKSIDMLINKYIN